MHRCTWISVGRFALNDHGPSMVCRVSALFFTDKICAEPLTEHLCMMDLMDSQPKKMYHTARVLHALTLGIEELHSLYCKVNQSNTTMLNEPCPTRPEGQSSQRKWPVMISHQAFRIFTLTSASLLWAETLQRDLQKATMQAIHTATGSA